MASSRDTSLWRSRMFTRSRSEERPEAMARLLMKKKNRTALIFMGEIVNRDGALWVVTGYDIDRDAVYIARDCEVRVVRPEQIGMHWEQKTT